MPESTPKSPGERIEMARFIHSYWRSRQTTAAGKGWTMEATRCAKIADRWQTQIMQMKTRRIGR